MQQTTFGRLLVDYRTAARWSVNELARAAGIDPSYVSRMETGERGVPRRRVVMALAAALELGASDSSALYEAAGYASVRVQAIYAREEASRCLFAGLVARPALRPRPCWVCGGEDGECNPEAHAAEGVW